MESKENQDRGGLYNESVKSHGNNRSPGWPVAAVCRGRILRVKEEVKKGGDWEILQQHVSELPGSLDSEQSSSLNRPTGACKSSFPTDSKLLCSPQPTQHEAPSGHGPRGWADPVLKSPEETVAATHANTKSNRNLSENRSLTTSS